jgi:Asp-tRNA(Asn)/Glu-tRNA(Gln) amidotransferase B subunit
MIKYSKDIFDFSKPKFTNDIDIYDENLIKYFEYTIAEDKIIYNSSNSSLIMEILKTELERFDEEKLSQIQKLKTKHLIKLANVVSQVRITDSANLKVIFDTFKQKEIKF